MFLPTGLLDCPKNSWSTGTEPAINSQYQRIQAIDPGRAPVGYNYAVSGARAASNPGCSPTTTPPCIGLDSQAQKLANEQDPDYVTIEIGANDACRSTIAAQTPTATFRFQVKDALDARRGELDGDLLLRLRGLGGRESGVVPYPLPG